MENIFFMEKGREHTHHTIFDYHIVDCDYHYFGFMHEYNLMILYPYFKYYDESRFLYKIKHHYNIVSKYFYFDIIFQPKYHQSEWKES